MTEPEVLDAEIVPEVDHEPPVTTSVALAPRERRSEVIRPLDPDALVESFAAYQSLLPRLLNEGDYQAAEAGKKFVKKSGWRKIATAFDLDVQIIAEEVERDLTGRILRAKTTARATAPSGRVMDGDGYCTIDEFTGRRASNPKLENDLRGTAATRAKNRAISDLVGMGEVSAEEAATPEHQTEPEASESLKATVLNVVGFLLDGNADAAYKAIDALNGQFDGRLPASAGQAIVLVGSAVKKQKESTARSNGV